MKLKKLVLSGFKSFADKTEFEFGSGISCIVGPNGCGKSNVVDAVKWVLGEQSAKSLRGSEMMDVIFNGSTSRKASGGAQVTLLFDNSEGLLRPLGGNGQDPSDTISVTRRLFRSGQSEYLINKTQCRLRDVREMFMDTGNAYSLIEQGRVESFLQASQDERRAIFDEAAGISKYKSRKKESLRKLERVEQNLLRVTDILAEVEKRLRSIKYQAGKARNYQKYSERLKELRSLYFLSQYHAFSRKRKELQGKVDAGVDRLNQLSAQIGKIEAAQSSGEVESVDLERSARQIQSRMATISGQITTCQERCDMLRRRVRELGEQIVSISARCEELEAKIEDHHAGLQLRQADLAKVEATAHDFETKYDHAEREHHQAQLEATRLHGELEDAKAGTIDLLRRTAQLHNEIHGLGIKRESLNGQRDRLGKRAEQLKFSLEEFLSERTVVLARLADADGVLVDARARLDEARAKSQQTSDEEQSLQRELIQTREQLSAISSRIEALEEMQQKREGLSEAVRRVLEAREQGRLSGIRGVLGQFVQADVEHAPVVEAALAGADQQLVVDALANVQTIVRQLKDIAGENGAIEILPLDQVSSVDGLTETPSCPRAVARAMDWVDVDPALAQVVTAMLGRTFVVRCLDDAIAASKDTEDLRFVTLDGDVIEADGRIRLAAANRGAHMVTRRSELVQLADRARQLTDSVADLEDRCGLKQNELRRLGELRQKLRTAIYEANTEKVQCQSRAGQLDQQVAKLHQEMPLIAADMENMASEIESALQAEQQARDNAAQLERKGAERQAEVDRISEQIWSSDKRREELNRQMTELKVELGKAEEKKRSIQEAAAAMERQRDQMDRDLSAGRSEIELQRQRISEAEAGISSSTEETEELYVQQQALDSESRELDQTRQTLTDRLEQMRSELAEHRNRHEDASQQVGQVRVELGESDVRIENLISRASDEMHMDLLALFETYEHDEGRDWSAVAAEIDELRGKIERLGNINLDAISEQDELDKRRQFLVDQLQDVKSSQQQLSELIRRINKESRQMFIETFTAVRESFQQLFRKLFGGGRADILLTDPEDVLESGIDILARPPGKELRSLTLLSGGEKTMTALALLFSIFRAKPSPFCLLDEVDAALDEANTERFSRLLQDFNENSQFVIISHAKRTMSMAGMLYGVTMSEPGVSKRISVRFEEVDHAMENDLEPVGA